MAIHLETERLHLRDWGDGDLKPFAALNADKIVMEFFQTALDRTQSDAMATRIQQGLDENGHGFFAVAVKTSGTFIGFAGLNSVCFEAPFTPAVEIGWRMAVDAWGHGYATEAARACLAYGFGERGFREVVSFTTRSNRRSMAVMERIGMSRNTDDDFEHPALPVKHPLRPHVLYRVGKSKN